MRAIVSFANNSGNYKKALDRLKHSLASNFDGQFFGFIGERTVGAPLHQDSNYAFKVYAIERVRNLGYTEVLWLDSSCYAIKNVAPIFDCIKRDGYYMQDSGWQIGHWTNGRTLAYYGMTRTDAMQMPMFSSGLTGMDFNNPKGAEFFKQWKQAMLDGMFNGSWEDHRHDQTCGSFIAQRLGFKYQENNVYAQYGCPDVRPIHDTCVIKLQGL